VPNSRDVQLNLKHLYIIRHGETDFNKAHKMQGRGIDASINELGRAQAEAIASALEDVPITKIVTSSLIRTLETAQPLIEKSKAVVESYKDLDEMSFGTLEGKVFERVQSDVKLLHSSWVQGELDVAAENGESPNEVFKRANAQVLKVLQNSGDEHIVFMLHGRLIRILLSVWLGYGLSKMDSISHNNGAINHLLWDGEEFKAIELNKTNHLPVLINE
tara:strand:+ start:7390 stop:8043 length:654 start_codon:yes stop_codon:yes gene_type:complete